MSLAARRAVDVAIDDRPGSDVRHDLNAQGTESETIAEDRDGYQCEIVTFPMKTVNIVNDIGSLGGASR
ncbi:hypothetical protein [Brevibacterium permense]|uniref:hypothetical protein n=1 Tax=Brevibacterium permense TaxID=234834 RepID=UPI0021D3C217|nr:hypothetical protein [Brevibacterium permense]